MRRPVEMGRRLLAAKPPHPDPLLRGGPQRRGRARGVGEPTRSDPYRTLMFGTGGATIPFRRGGRRGPQWRAGGHEHERDRKPSPRRPRGGEGWVRRPVEMGRRLLSAKPPHPDPLLRGGPQRRGRARGVGEPTRSDPYRTLMFGTGGATIPFPIWKPGCGGWLYAVFSDVTCMRYCGSCISV